MRLYVKFFGKLFQNKEFFPGVVNRIFNPVTSFVLNSSRGFFAVLV